MQVKDYEMTVCVPNSRGVSSPVREYGHRGLTFVEGRKHQNYTLKFRNNSARRVLAVVSVDGVSVVDGKPADNDSRGYIVPAYAVAEIKGWRTSKTETHDFVFDTKNLAYSTQEQKEDTNCGVVAVKVFDEKITLNQFTNILRKVTEEHHHHHHHYERLIHYPIYPQPTWLGGNTGTGITYGCNTVDNSTSLSGGQESRNLPDEVFGPILASAASPAAQENPDFNLGTGWGKARVDEVDEVNFDRGIELACFSIYYSDSEGLKAAGIEVDKKPSVSAPVLPRGFNGFCKPPVVTSS